MGWFSKRQISGQEQREEARYALQAIRSFLDGSGGPHDWDAFTSCSLRDPRLDRIRRLASAVDLPLGHEERASLEVLAEQAERLAEG